LTIAIGLTGGVGLTAGEGASRRDDDGHGHGCSAATLRGDYGFLVSGFKPVPPPVGGLERFNAVGIFDFDGGGTFTFEPGGALQGEITSANPPPTNPVGTYEVNPNCTGEMSWQPDPPIPVLIRYTIVVVERGRQIKLATATGLSQGEATRR
jgi:hypothetical protein